MENKKKKKRPQVLLLGNGINRAFNGDSWEWLLCNITTNPICKCIGVRNIEMPMPLKAILVSEDTINDRLGKQKEEQLFGQLKSNEQKEMLERLLNLGFDEILTTNYSYELEMAASGNNNLSRNQIEKMMDFIKHGKTNRAESKYLIHTFNRPKEKYQIWHIHGEARKPNSIVLGHYYYGKLIQRIMQYLDGRKYYLFDKMGKKNDISSWIDAFILGDVYVLGLGYDVSEFDLWWLLNRKKNEEVNKGKNEGKLYFFEPRTSEFDEKIELLKVLGAEYHDCGVQCYEGKNKIDYVGFYNKAIEEIGKIMKKK